MENMEENYFKENFKDFEEAYISISADRPDETIKKDLIVLKPDHPLMQKFQVTLNEFLQKENERVRIEVLELEENLKKERHEYEKQMGYEIFNFEQELNQQRKLLMDFEEKLDFNRKQYTEKNHMLKTRRENYKKFNNKLNDDKKKSKQLLGELEALTMLCKQYEIWDKDTNSELVVHQRISEKINSDKLLMMEEKKKMDILVYKVRMEIWNLESEMDLIDEQTKIKMDETESVTNRIGDSTADLQALEMEHHRLLQLWNAAVINIQQKDKTLSSLNLTYEDTQTNFKALTQKIELIKKEIDDEMRRHESIVMMRNKSLNQLMDCSKSVQSEESKKNYLETVLMDISSALELTEKDLQIEKMESLKNKNNMKGMIIQCEKLATEKINLENETLDKLQNRLNNDKTVDDLADKIKGFKRVIRKSEENMLDMENQLSKITLKIEKQRYTNSQNQIQVNDDKNAFEKKKKELNTVEDKLKETHTSIEKNQTALDVVNKKINSFLEKNEGNEQSPVERKIEELENQIKLQINTADGLRKNWMRMQKHVISLTKTYQKHTSDIILIQQQLQVMEYKLHKAKDRVCKKEEDKNAIQRLIEAELHKIDWLSKEKCKNKAKNENLQDKYNDLTIDSMAKLKDAEVQVMTLKEEISEFENEKERLAIELDKLERNNKHWRKMEILAVETKQKVKEEKCATGELGRMKMEIHRMQVRQGQVTRTAGRLASDLAQAVWRRAAAVYRNRAMSQKTTPKYTYSTKNKEKRSDIRRIDQEIEMNQNSLKIMSEEQSILKKNIQEKKIILATLENEISKIKQQINDDYLHKQANLERIIRHQRYGQHCAMVLSGRIRIHSVKSESIITTKYEKECKINSQLINLIKFLISDIPEYRTILTKIMNTLIINEE